jgi:hypothetical protein
MTLRSENSMARIVRMALAAALITAGNPVAFSAEGLTTLSTGADYSSGDYGLSDSTRVFYVPVTAKHETGRWAFKLVVPYIRITGPSNVVGAPENQVILPDLSFARRTESGLGDVVASAFYNVLNPRGAPLGLDFGAKIKFGTADDSRGLGTGKNDFSLQADFFKAIGAFTPFGTLGYRRYGDPEGVDLRNVVYGTVGSSYRISQPTTVGLAYDWRDRIVEGRDRVSELTAYVSRRLSGNWKLQVYAVRGFTNASPDFGGGLSLAYSF